MGNKGSVTTLKPNVLKQLTESTHFNQEEIIALHEHFKVVSKGSADETIDSLHFLSSLGINKSKFLERMFTLFDSNKDGRITFVEYLSGLSVLCSRGRIDEKVLFAFQIYDMDGDGKISKQELSEMLRATLEENTLKVTKKQMKNIIEYTFEQADKNQDGFIDMTEFRKLSDEDRTMLSNMTIDFKAVIDSAKVEN
jgi:Ca2+-binding EF-hand superfamily protein